MLVKVTENTKWSRIRGKEERILIAFFPWKNLRIDLIRSPHFPDEETETLIEEVLCSKSHS